MLRVGSIQRHVSSLLVMVLVSVLVVPAVSFAETTDTTATAEVDITEEAVEAELVPAETPPVEFEAEQQAPAEVQPSMAAFVAVAGNLFGDSYEVDNTVGQAKPIDVEGWQSHTIHVVDDEDWVKFEAVDGAEYVIQTYLGDPEFETTIELYDTDGTTLVASDSGGGFDDTFSELYFDASATGTYYLRVSADGECGAYRLRVVGGDSRPADAYEPDDSFTEATVLTVGMVQDRTIHQIGDQDWVTIDVVAGEDYVFHTSPGEDDFDTYLYLYESDGVTLIDSNDDGGYNYYSLISYHADATETLYLQVSHYSDSGVGRYRLAVTLGTTPTVYQPDSYEVDDAVADAKPISTDGTPQARTIHAADDVDFAVFQAVAGTQYVIELREISWEFDTYLHLYESDGETEITSDDDGGLYRGSYIMYEATEDGPLYIQTHSYDYEEPGEYTLSVSSAVGDAYEVDDTAAEAKPAALDVTQRRTIHSDTDEDWIYLDVVSDITYTFDTRVGDIYFDTVVTLYDSDASTEIDSDDDTGPGTYSHLAFTPDSNKRVYLAITPYSSGDLGAYTLTVDCDDVTAPVTTSNTGATYTDSATISLNASDPSPGVGVAATYYTLDGGPKQTYLSPIAVSSAGAHTLTFWSVDKIANEETAKTVTFTVVASAPPVVPGTPSATPSSGSSTGTGKRTDGDAEDTQSTEATTAVEVTPEPEQEPEDEEDGEPVEEAQVVTTSLVEDGPATGSVPWAWIVVGLALAVVLVGGLLKIKRS